jgi:isopenicillin-N N-acyltransferase-like protein
MQLAIQATFHFYSALFGGTSKAIRDRGDRVLDRIAEFHLPYAELIDGLASSCGLAAGEVAALNARTELLHEAGLVHQECTSAFIPTNSTLGQNWDWSRSLEPLMFLLRVNDISGHSFVTLSEPGIIGKIGMNSFGLGVCLNILPSKGYCDGVPVHILLRAVLDSECLEEAKDRIASAKLGSASSILVANHLGESFCAEICGTSVSFTHHDKNPVVRTNHFCDFKIPIPALFLDSTSRLKRAQHLLKNEISGDPSPLESLFADQKQSDAKILSPFFDSSDGLGEVGTLATIIMDLKARRMSIKKIGSKSGFADVMLN